MRVISTETSGFHMRLRKTKWIEPTKFVHVLSSENGPFCQATSERLQGGQGGLVCPRFHGLLALGRKPSKNVCEWASAVGTNW
jgi:hypothetical protein